MNLLMTFRQLQSRIVTSCSSGKRFSANGEKTLMMWWVAMHGKVSHLGVETAPETMTIVDMDNNDQVLNYSISKRTDKQVTYTCPELPNFPIYLDVA